MTKTVGVAGVFLSVVVALPCVGSLAVSCSVYDDSLLRYADAGVDSKDGAQDTEPESSTDSSLEDVSSEPDVTVEAEGGEDADGGEGGEQDVAAPCTEKTADCDGNADNGCETDITMSAEHCGKCGHSCLGGECAGSRCMPITLASGQTQPSGIALDPVAGGGRVYWTNRADQGTVHSVAGTGGEVTTLATDQARPGGIVVDATSVHWANAGVTAGTGQIMSVAKDADAAAPTVLLANQQTPMVLTQRGTRLFWSNSVNAVGSIGSVDVSGSDPIVVVGDQDQPSGVVADETGVYWAVMDSGEVRKCFAVPCVTVQVMGTGIGSPLGIAVDTVFVYWTSLDGKVAKANKVTKEVTDLATGQSLPVGVAVDGTHAYFANNMGSTICRVPKIGGAVEELASGQNGPFAVAVDNDAVYWVTQNGGTVMKVAK